MNSGTVFKLCVPLHVCSRLCLRVTFAGTSRDKAPSARSRLSWLPAPLTGPEERLSVSIVMKPTLLLPLLLFLLRCLLMLTANNVLLDDCALLEPQSRDRDEWREAGSEGERETETDTHEDTSEACWSLSGLVKLPGEDCTRTHTHGVKVRPCVLCFISFFLLLPFCSLSPVSASLEGEDRGRRRRKGSIVSLQIPYSSPADTVLCQEDPSCWC